MLALDYLPETTHSLAAAHVRAGVSGKGFPDEEGLGEEALELPRPVDGLSVLLGELLDAEDGDDVLEVLIALENALHLVRDPVMLFAHDIGRKRSRGGLEGVDGWVNS